MHILTNIYTIYDSTGNVLMLQIMALFSGAYLTVPVAAYMVIIEVNAPQSI